MTDEKDTDKEETPENGAKATAPADMIVPLRLGFEEIGGETTVEKLIISAEFAADEVAGVAFKILFEAYSPEPIPTGVDEKIACPGSRHSANIAMSEDFSDYGWILTLALDPNSWIWTAILQREGDNIDGVPDIEEWGYSREMATGAAWVRMRDFEKLKAN